MAEWIYFLHVSRENFAATMTAEEQAIWGLHFERLERLLEEGTLIMAGPTLGPVNTGIAVIEAPDEDAARRLMEEDPAITSGVARGELRPFRVSLLRGRDEPRRYLQLPQPAKRNRSRRTTLGTGQLPSRSLPAATTRHTPGRTRLRKLTPSKTLPRSSQEALRRPVA